MLTSARFLSGADKDCGVDSVYNFGKDSVAYGGDGKRFDNEDERSDNFSGRGRALRVLARIGRCGE